MLAEIAAIAADEQVDLVLVTGDLFESAAPPPDAQRIVWDALLALRATGARVIANMLKYEGPSAFFKGLVPKLLMTGPKLTFSFWLAQTLIPAFNKVL